MDLLLPQPVRRKNQRRCSVANKAKQKKRYTKVDQLMKTDIITEVSVLSQIDGISNPVSPQVDVKCNSSEVITATMLDGGSKIGVVDSQHDDSPYSISDDQSISAKSMRSLPACKTISCCTGLLTDTDDELEFEPTADHFEVDTFYRSEVDDDCNNNFGKLSNSQVEDYLDSLLSEVVQNSSNVLLGPPNDASSQKLNENEVSEQLAQELISLDCDDLRSHAMGFIFSHFGDESLSNECGRGQISDQSKCVECVTDCLEESFPDFFDTLLNDQNKIYDLNNCSEHLSASNLPIPDILPTMVHLPAFKRTSPTQASKTEPYQHSDNLPCLLSAGDDRNYVTSDHHSLTQHSQLSPTVVEGIWYPKTPKSTDIELDLPLSPSGLHTPVFKTTTNWFSFDSQFPVTFLADVKYDSAPSEIQMSSIVFPSELQMASNFVPSELEMASNFQMLPETVCQTSSEEHWMRYNFSNSCTNYLKLDLPIIDEVSSNFNGSVTVDFINKIDEDKQKNNHLVDTEFNDFIAGLNAIFPATYDNSQTQLNSCSMHSLEDLRMVSGSGPSYCRSFAMPEKSDRTAVKQQIDLPKLKDLKSQCDKKSDGQTVPENLINLKMVEHAAKQRKRSATKRKNSNMQQGKIPAKKHSNTIKNTVLVNSMPITCVIQGSFVQNTAEEQNVGQTEYISGCRNVFRPLHYAIGETSSSSLYSSQTKINHEKEERFMVKIGHDESLTKSDNSAKSARCTQDKSSMETIKATVVPVELSKSRIRNPNSILSKGVRENKVKVAKVVRNDDGVTKVIKLVPIKDGTLTQQVGTHMGAKCIQLQLSDTSCGSDQLRILQLPLSVKNFSSDKYSAFQSSKKRFVLSSKISPAQNPAVDGTIQNQKLKVSSKGNSICLHTTEIKCPELTKNSVFTDHVSVSTDHLLDAASNKSASRDQSALLRNCVQPKSCSSLKSYDSKNKTQVKFRIKNARNCSSQKSTIKNHITEDVHAAQNSVGIQKLMKKRSLLEKTMIIQGHRIGSPKSCTELTLGSEFWSNLPLKTPEYVLKKLCLPSQTLSRGFLLQKDITAVQMRAMADQCIQLQRYHMQQCTTRHCRACLCFSQQKDALSLSFHPRVSARERSSWVGATATYTDRTNSLVNDMKHTEKTFGTSAGRVQPNAGKLQTIRRSFSESDIHYARSITDSQETAVVWWRGWDDMCLSVLRKFCEWPLPDTRNERDQAVLDKMQLIPAAKIFPDDGTFNSLALAAPDADAIDQVKTTQTSLTRNIGQKMEASPANMEMFITCNSANPTPTPAMVLHSAVLRRLKKEASLRSLQRNNANLSIVESGCSCTTSCRISSCKCTQMGVVCGSAGLCGCTDCDNPLNVLCALKLDVSTMRTDLCLMRNIYNYDLVSLCQILSSQFLVPCCHASLSVLQLVPGRTRCVCGSTLSLSWCNWQVHLESMMPRNHCWICGHCVMPLHHHCQNCGHCTTSLNGYNCMECGHLKVF